MSVKEPAVARPELGELTARGTWERFFRGVNLWGRDTNNFRRRGFG